MRMLFVTVPVSSPVGTQYPMLGVAYIASYVHKYSGHTVKICDAALGESMFAAVKNFKPDIVGFTFNSIGATVAEKMATKLRSRHPDLKIVCGGVHASFMTHCQPKIYDSTVVGEGEQTTLDLLDDYEASRTLKKTYQAAPITPLDRIPPPERSLYNMNYYLQPLPHFPGYEGKGVNMLTSRGCMFKCVFCPSSHFWGTPRLHSAEYVIAEMQSLVEQYGVEYINFWDDLFHIDKKRLRRIVALFKEANLTVQCGGQCHAGLFDEETAKLLREMNFVYCGFGMESMSPSVLKYLKNGVTTPEDNRRAVRICRKYGLKVGSGFITGFSQEKPEDVKANLDFIASAKLDAYNIYVLTPYPGTPLWREALEKRTVSDTMDFGMLHHVFNCEKVFMR